MDEDAIKPHYGAFVFKPLVLVLVPVLAIVSVFLLTKTGVGLLLLVTSFFGGIGYFAWLRERYRKTHYLFTEEKIRVVTGTYISDSDREVLWSKIVLPTLKRGILQKYLFGTGSILLQAAGQAETEIVLQELTGYAELFDRILERTPIQTHDTNASPESSYRQSTLGITLDFLLPTTIFTLAVLSVTLVTFELTNPDAFLEPLKFWVPLGILGLCTFVFGFISIVKANIVYNVHPDSVERVVDFVWYEETVVSLSILSDVNLYQPVHKRLFGLSNLSLSVPGVGEDTSLVNLREGESLRRKLQDRSDELKERESESDHTDRGIRFEARPVFLSHLAVPLLIVLACSGLSALLGNVLGQTLSPEVFHWSGKMLGGNQIILFLMASIPLLIGSSWFLYRFVNYWASSFAVEGNRVELTYSFLSRSVTSLSTDKIKAIVKGQGIIERFFDTYTLIFHSIGTERNIEFFSVRNNQGNAEMLRHIREREGSYGGQSTRTIEPSFSRSGLFQNPLVLALSFVVVFGPALVLGLVLDSQILMGGGLAIAVASTYGTIAYLKFYYGNCVALELFPEYLVFREGYFITQEYYVVYHDIRNVKYAREPGSDNGWFTVDFASGGGQTQQQQANNNDIGTIIRALRGPQGSFTVQHLEDVEATASALEDVFSESVAPENFDTRLTELKQRESGHSDRLRATPRALPYVGMGMLYGLIPLAIIPESYQGLMATAFLTSVPTGGVLGWLYHKTISYTIKDDRVESSHWIVFTRSKSIKYKNIDNIETDQNFLGKILRMGNVKVSTTGGSGVEMTAKYLPDYQSFYRELQDEYSEATTSETI